MTEADEYLAELGLEPGKVHNAQQVKAAWRKKVSACHPDKGGDKGKFLAVMHSYKMLTDPSYQREETVKPKPNLDIHFRIAISFEDAFFGRVVSFTFSRPTLGADFKPMVQEREEIATVTFPCPPGKMQEYQVQHAGLGCKYGEEMGNALIIIVPRAHPVFRVEGLDGLSQERVPLDLMLKGGEFEVQTMYGLRTMKIPPGTAPHDKLAIPRVGVNKQGNHIVHLEPVYPTKDDLKKPAWNGLHINWPREAPPAVIKDVEDPIFTLYEEMRKCSPSSTRRTDPFPF